MESYHMDSTQSKKLKHLLQKNNFWIVFKGPINCHMKKKMKAFNFSFCHFKALWEAQERKLCLN